MIAGQVVDYNTWNRSILDMQLLRVCVYLVDFNHSTSDMRDLFLSFYVIITAHFSFVFVRRDFVCTVLDDVSQTPRFRFPFLAFTFLQHSTFIGLSSR
jgi:hypothetical protein